MEENVSPADVINTPPQEKVITQEPKKQDLDELIYAAKKKEAEEQLAREKEEETERFYRLKDSLDRDFEILKDSAYIENINKAYNNPLSDKRDKVLNAKRVSIFAKVEKVENDFELLVKKFGYQPSKIEEKTIAFLRQSRDSYKLLDINQISDVDEKISTIFDTFADIETKHIDVGTKVKRDITKMNFIDRAKHEAVNAGAVMRDRRKQFLLKAQGSF